MKACYRSPGLASEASMRFHKAIQKAGWSKEICDNFIKEVPSFESGSIACSWQDGLRSFIHPPPVEFHPFLKQLARHIQELAQAERYETAQAIATNMDHPEFMKAQYNFIDLSNKRKKEK